MNRKGEGNDYLPDRGVYRTARPAQCMRITKTVAAICNVAATVFLNRISRPLVLYSGHKESGLIKISLPIGLDGPGWAWSCTWAEKAERPGTDSLLEKDVFPMPAKRNMPRRSHPGRSCGVWVFRCITAIIFNDDLLATWQDKRQFATAEIRHLD